MPAPREIPRRVVPRSVADTLIGDNSKPGAMASLANLLFDPSTPGVLYCRPANIELSSFSGLTAPRVVSVAFQLNGIIYGMIASGSPAGKDRPFAYNPVNNTFQTISGVTAANCPTTQPTSGDWVPPTMDALGSRLIVTHPGFNLAAGYAFGYFDISGFSDTTTGDITSGSATVSGNPNITGVAPGYPMSGAGIPAATTVLNYASFSLTTTGNTNTSTSLTSVANTSGLAVGQPVAGLGIPSGTVITAISGSTVTISNAATATATGVSLFFTGATITMSANATATTNGLSITIAGGTAGAPLWAAGNTTGNIQLLGVPQAVRQFSNRAWFAQSNNLVFTDTLSLNVSNASGVQVLTVGDTAPITALCGLPEYTSSSGVLQALLAFKANYISQITGDIALATLDQNTLSGSVGTAAPRSVVTTPNGVYFMANDGIRNVDLVGEVSEINVDLALPFIYAEHPSRVAACFNSDAYRICTQNTNKLNAPYEDYHYYFKYDGWSGPHSFRYDLAVPYMNNFIEFNTALPATMWLAYAVQDQQDTGNTFVENGVQLTWVYETCPMTDADNMYGNTLVRSTLDLAQPSTGDIYNFQALDANSEVLAQAQVRTPSTGAVWDAFDWGDGTLWGGAQTGLEAVSIPWTQPPIFNRLVFQATGASSLGLKIGAAYNGYEKLGYLLQ